MFGPAVDNEFSSESESSENTSDDGAEDIDPTQSMPHPRDASAWATRRMLMTVSSPPQPAALAECQQELEAIGDEAGNPDDLERLEGVMQSLVTKDARVAHFCFYRTMAIVDTALDREPPLVPANAQKFFQRMKGLWLLARALDSSLETSRYFSYLKKRYLQISEEQFGRRLDTIAPPLGSEETQGVPEVSLTPGGKDAGAFE